MQSEALQLATIQEYDIALVDYNLPIQNGLEVLQEMRKRQPGCVRILITGMLNEEARRWTVNRGEVSHIVRKPFRNEDLINAVNADRYPAAYGESCPSSARGSKTSVRF